MIKKIIKKIKPLYKLLKKLTLLSLKLLYIFLYLTKKEKEKNDKSLIILGTGPSMKNDFERIVKHKDNCDIMAVNSFLLNDNFAIIKPNVYVLADPSYFSSNVTGFCLKDRDIFINRIMTQLTWKLTLYLPLKAKGSYLVETLSKNNLIEIKFVTDNQILPYFINKFKAYNKNIALPSFYNVLCMCLSIGCYEKYNNIYFFGADHNWFQDLIVGEDNLVYITEKHCYEEQSSKGLHYSQYADGSPISMGDMFTGFGKLFNEYYDIKKWADYNEIKIYNESSVSFIDAFNRKSGFFEN